MIGRAWGSVWRELAAALLVTAGAMLAGLTVTSGAVLGVAAAAFVVLGRRFGSDPDPSRVREKYVRPDGGRGELQDLAWTVVGNDGRAGERALRRLREVAAVRLARHGVDLWQAVPGNRPGSQTSHPTAPAQDEQRDRPGDEEALRALVGDRAARTLTRRSSPLPSVADLEHTLGVLERLGPHPHPGAADQNPEPPGRPHVPRRTWPLWRNR